MESVIYHMLMIGFWGTIFEDFRVLCLYIFGISLFFTSVYIPLKLLIIAIPNSMALHHIYTLHVAFKYPHYVATPTESGGKTVKHDRRFCFLDVFPAKSRLAKAGKCHVFEGG